ncbi:enoyl-CoA hydratase/isomerase family protein [Nocardia sp. BMG111209]|uniref:enoyl-CoA hydratase/isomerase family protein n=1 Tax=Nocardia sp. BMG111209 TaxID=1160137 RepID=UPI00039A6862|nr:enoyl-CoA hydratase-related protein [Nocardia sp. BMG111209]
MSSTRVERADGLVTIIFDRPAKKNALGAEDWDILRRTLIEVTDDPADRALLLTGAGGNFSAGADLSGNMSSGDGRGLTGGAQQSILFEMRAVGEIVDRLHRLPKPTLAAVDGVAFGVALGLVLACDLVLASDRARFCEVFVKRGLALDGGTSWTLPRQVGQRRAKQIAMLGDEFGADRALEWGLINEVVPADELPKVARDWATRLAAGPTTALSLIKRSLDGSDSISFAQALEDEARAQHIVFTTHDMREGITAFLQRRPPNFTGR